MSPAPAEPAPTPGAPLAPAWWPAATGLGVGLLSFLLQRVWFLVLPLAAPHQRLAVHTGLSLVLGGLVWYALDRARRARLRLIQSEERAAALAASEREAIRVRGQLTAFIEHAPAAVAMLDRDLRYLAYSRRWLEDYRLGARDLHGWHHYDVFPEIRQLPGWQAVHQRALQGQVERCEEDLFVREDGTQQWTRWEVRPWYDALGAIGGIVMLTEDVSARKRAALVLQESLQEKEVLLKEVHHRVKNNLAVVSSLLYLQEISAEDPAVVATLSEGRARVQSMALVHELLYQSSSLSSVDFGQYIRQLTDSLVQGLVTGTHVTVTCDTDPVVLGVDRGVPCGLILNEMLTNAVKHAFVGRADGHIVVRLRAADARCVLEVEDDGVGVPGPDAPTTRSLGVTLMRTLARQLDGEFVLSSATQGTVARLTFPL